MEKLIRKKIGIFLALLLLVPFSACAESKDPSTIVADDDIKKVDASDYFLSQELLGLVTDSSATVKMLAAKDLDVYAEYGTKNGKYTSKTDMVTAMAGSPFILQMSGLKEDTKYYYRVCYREKDKKKFYGNSKHSFHTQRKEGESFVFTVQSDSHRDEKTDEELYHTTLENILADKPDFHIDLGDTFMTEKFAGTEEDVVNRYQEERDFFGVISHSVPLYLVNGNHEGENGWKLNGTENNIAVWAANARLAYYLNPLPDTFYSGNEDCEDFVGMRGGYYSFEWGDALFIVLDPFWNTEAKSNSLEANWNYSLGKEQYDWFESVLENSSVKYKFVFIHNLAGGSDKNGRGGSEAAGYFEWGGLNSDGSYGFDKNRPGWGEPIHQLMAENNVTAVFHGHDHFFAKQELDGIVYQLVPQPGNPNYKNSNQAEEYGYLEGVIMPPAGHIRVKVADTGVTVDYVRSYLDKDESPDRKNGEIGYCYILE